MQNIFVDEIHPKQQIADFLFNSSIITLSTQELAKNYEETSEKSIPKHEIPSNINDNNSHSIITNPPDFKKQSTLPVLEEKSELNIELNCLKAAKKLPKQSKPKNGESDVI